MRKSWFEIQGGASIECFDLKIEQGVSNCILLTYRETPEGPVVSTLLSIPEAPIITFCLSEDS